MKTVIANVKVILEQGILEDGWVLLEGGVIRWIGTSRGARAAGEDAEPLEQHTAGVAGAPIEHHLAGVAGGPMEHHLADVAGGLTAQTIRAAEGFSVVDGCGRYLAPGFIDIHLHGGSGHDFMDATQEAFQGIADYHCAHGITSMLATTLAGEEGETLRMLRAFADYAPRIRNCNLLGVHLEGPYFSVSQRGAQDPGYITLPDRKQTLRFLETGCIKRMSMAPELPGAMELAGLLQEQGVLVSAGHTQADYDVIKTAAQAGFGLLTHLYSGMLGVHRKGPFRRGGAVEAGLLLDTLAVELIADGCHLPPCLLRLVRRCKKPENIILVSDAMRGAGLAEGSRTRLGSLEKGQEVLIEDGVAMLPDRTSFAGSIASGDRLIRTMRDWGQVPLYEAVAMMTANPARLLGIADRKGSIREGMDADLVLFDEDISVKAVWVSGRKVL